MEEDGIEKEPNSDKSEKANMALIESFLKKEYDILLDFAGNGRFNLTKEEEQELLELDREIEALIKKRNLSLFYKKIDKEIEFLKQKRDFRKLEIQNSHKKKHEKLEQQRNKLLEELGKRLNFLDILFLNDMFEKYYKQICSSLDNTIDEYKNNARNSKFSEQMAAFFYGKKSKGLDLAKKIYVLKDQKNELHRVIALIEYRISMMDSDESIKRRNNNIKKATKPVIQNMKDNKNKGKNIFEELNERDEDVNGANYDPNFDLM